MFGLRLDDKSSGKISAKNPRWEELLPVVDLGPNSRHIFQLNAKAQESTWSALMVRMIPDGGMVSTWCNEASQGADSR